MQDKIHGRVNFPALVTAITRRTTLSRRAPTIQTSEQMVKVRCWRQKIANESVLWRLSHQVDGCDFAAGREIEYEDTNTAAGEFDPCHQAAGIDVGSDDFGTRREDNALRHRCRHRSRRKRPAMVDAPNHRRRQDSDAHEQQHAEDDH